jgi:5-methylcytosine-specific restriction endonuclease McrA
MGSANWREDVYRASDKRPDIPLEVRREVVSRDKFCRVCEGIGKELHHIIPFAEGGKTTPDNLILLCKKCHDEIELAGYRTRAEIEGHLPEWRNRQRARHKLLNNPAPKPLTEDGDWHLWVYGGYRNPRV